MDLSGFRVRRSHPAFTRLLTVLADHGPTRVRPFDTLCYTSVVGLATCDEPWQDSNNSAHPIHRESLASSPLRSPDVQAQPSKGTQGNHGSDSPLAGGNKLRAVQSYLSLACGEFVRCKSRSPRRGIRQVRARIKPHPSKRWAGSIRRIESMSEIESSGFVRLLSGLHHQRNRQ